MDGTRPTRGRTRLVRLALYLLFAASGAAGLGYQFVWTRQFGLGFGQEMPAVLATVTSFFAGFGLGAWLLAPRIAASRHPARWYAGLELVIGGWALFTVLLVPPRSGNGPGPRSRSLAAMALDGCPGGDGTGTAARHRGHGGDPARHGGIGPTGGA